MKNYIITLICVFFSFGLQAQDYYVKDSSKWIVGLNTRYLSLNSDLKLGDNTLSYANLQQSIGVRVGYKGLVLVVAVAAFPQNEDLNKPQSNMNCVLRFYPKNMYFKIDGSFSSRNHGLGDYLSDFNESYNDDLFVWNLDVHGLYAFNKNRINVKSFFAFRDQQLRSAGSWTANAYVKSTLVNADSFTLEDAGFDSNQVPHNLFFNRVGFGGGYLYAYKLTDRIQWANMVSLASEVIVSDTFGTNAEPTTYDFILNLRPSAFSSLVYNNKQYYTGLQFEYSPRVSSSNTINQYQLEFYSIRLSSGYRW